MAGYCNPHARCPPFFLTEVLLRVIWVGMSSVVTVTVIQDLWVSRSGIMAVLYHL